ncbi:protein phosphatase Slingshot homolog 2 isoform X2 [Tachyglossus aculeatus]|uniref:protein phosphatase Slingshot homolog 2 isoform X2 n=1 Tax=Tachyglossus aculeatus TaxID=9261 RepID=UPI0018F39E78|nr:protein phosphatase Slingshot homolog 2 isoform X2 [Tachyglossus aculeatus]
MALVTVQRSPTPSTTSSPCASEADSGEEECRSQPRSISESFLTVKGAALFLPRGNGSSTPRISHRRNKHAGDLQQHLQAMFLLLRPEDSIRLAVRLESTYQNRTRYMVVVSTNGRQDTEESIVLGMDFSSNDSSTCTMGLVLPLWSDTLIHLDGDGGFSVSTDNRVHIFKPVSVQAMWSALQSLHKACEVARSHNYYPGSLFLTWVSYYESHINSDQSSVNEWNAMQDVQSHRPDSPALFTDVPTERERTERLIKTKLREIMMQKDLENITSKEIRTELEMQMVCNLREFKEFIDNEMIVILGQMDSPTQIFEHVFLGSEWNASNLEDLQNRGVRYILNVTREIDNFFPGVFEYHNIRVYDEEATDLLAYWNDTYKFISKAKKHGSKCLVHCKMGVSRSASTVIAYAMKEYGWNLDRAYDYVKKRRTVTKPNPSFMRQLEEYQGILLASKQRHNKLWRSHSDSDLSDHHEPIGKSGMELNRKEITSSADQITESKTLDSHPSIPPLFMEHVVQPDANPKELCPQDRMICFEFTSREFHTGQIEDKLNLNNLNGCPASCFSLDNCQVPEAMLQPQRPLEMAPAFLDLTLEDLETDALKTDNSVHLLPMEELTSRLKDLPASPDPSSPSPQPCPQAEVSDFSTDRIDFFSAREKFVELSQETRSRSHSRSDEAGAGRNGLSRLSASEAGPPEVGGDGQRSTSSSNTPHTSESSTDEEQPKEVPEPVSTGLPRSHSENAISVKEIITELESIHQGIGQCQQKADALPSLCHTPKRSAVQEPPAEGACTAESRPANPGPDPGRNPGRWGPEGSPGPPQPAPALEEGDSGEEEPEPRGPAGNPGPKWCPGSVRRATLEFEERLRQEQEHHGASPICTLPPRKNSKNDPAPAETTPRGKSEGLVLEPPPGPREPEISGLDGKGSGPEAGSPLQPEAPVPPEPQPAPVMRDSLPPDPCPKQEGAPKEPRTVIPGPGSEAPALSSPCPKRIEIIECSQEVKPPDPQRAGSGGCMAEKSGERGLAKAKVEKPSQGPVCALDENRNSTLCPEVVPPRPGVLSLPPAGLPQASFTLGSPEEEVPGPPAPTGTAAPFVSHAAHLPSANWDFLQPRAMVHIEGITEQDSTTDLDAAVPSTWQAGPDPGSDGGGGPPRNGENLKSVGQHTESGHERPEGRTTCSPTSPFPRGPPCRGGGGASQSLSPRRAGGRARETEARLRHAGLTAPSQMKRSASLAKLGCLDLSKDDFCTKEPAPPETACPCPCPALPRSPSGADPTGPGFGSGPSPAEPQAHPQDPEPTKYFVEQLKTTECIVQSKPIETPLVQYAKDFGSTQQNWFPSPGLQLTRSEGGCPSPQAQVPDSPRPAPPLALSVHQQYGRTHPLRRLKRSNDKRTTRPFYNTM